MNRIITFILIMLLIVVFASCNPKGEASFTVTQDGNAINQGDTYDFGDVPVGLNSNLVEFIIENTGETSFNVFRIELGGVNPDDFTISPETVSGEIQPEETMTFSLMFIPQQQEPRSAELTITTDVKGSESFLINLTGTGIEATYEWVENNPATKPSPRISRGLVYGMNNKMILFGGLSSGLSYLGDTWEYDISTDTWTNLNPSNSLSARTNFGMTRSDNDTAVLFGGYNGSRLGDTWEYDITSNSWSDLSPGGTAPEARSGHKLINGRNGKLYMFGGRTNSSGWTNEIWEYDVASNTWALLSPTGSVPIDRSHFGWAYGGDDKLVMFGGLDGNTRLDDTWVFDISDNQWTEQSPTTAPHEREYHTMTYIGDNTIMMFGGYFWDTVNPAVFYNDTWEYDTTTNEWTEITIDSTKPHQRYAHSLAWVEGVNKVILFAGYYYINMDETYYNDTWTYVFP